MEREEIREKKEKRVRARDKGRERREAKRGRDPSSRRSSVW